MSVELTTLSEYARIQGGYAYKSKDFSSEGNYPVLKIKNVRFGHVDYSEASYISEDVANETREWKTEEGDILISMTGSGPNAPQSLVGRVARVWADEPEAWINQRVGKIVLRNEGSIHPDFLFYLLSSSASQDYLVSNSSGSANQANISGKIIESLPCPKIGYEESAQIAKILRDLDKKILINRQTNQTLEHIAQAIFKSWFVDFEPTRAKIIAKEQGANSATQELAAQAIICGAITLEQLAEVEHNLETTLQQAIDEKLSQGNQTPINAEQLKATAVLFPNELVESELGDVPEGWEAKPFSVYAKITKGKNITKKNAVPGDVPVVAGGLLPAYWHNEHNVEGPAITISASGANAGYVNLYNQNIWSSDSSYINKQSTSYFYTAYVCLKYYQKAIYDMQTGAAQPHIYPKDFERLNVVLGSDELLEKLENLLFSFFEKTAVFKSEAETLTQLRDTLLPKLLSGELDVSALTDNAEADA